MDTDAILIVMNFVLGKLGNYCVWNMSGYFLLYDFSWIYIQSENLKKKKVLLNTKQKLVKGTIK